MLKKREEGLTSYLTPTSYDYSVKSPPPRMLACEWWQDLLTRPTWGMKWHESVTRMPNVAAWWELRSNETKRNHKWVAKGTFDTHIFVWFKYAGLSVWSLVRTGPENLCVSTAALFLIIHGLKQIPRACSIFDEAIVTLQNGWYTRFIKFFNGKGYFFEGAQ